MRRLLVMLLLATLGALALGARFSPMPVEERVVRIRAADLPGGDSQQIASLPIEVQAVLVDYAGDEALSLKAQAALRLQPVRAARVLALYGPEPDFMAILRTHGDSVLLPIEFFLDNEIAALTMARRLWPGNGDRQSPSAEERGWQAVQYIREEGHGFLGQFVVDADGRVQWLQSERVLEGLGQFFAGGVRRLESRWRTGEPIEAADVGWAMVDVVAVVGAVHLLRIGKLAASAARGGDAATQASRFAIRLARAGQVGANVASRMKWPALLGAGYLVLRNPALLGDVFSTVGGWFGLSTEIAVIGGWALLLLVVLTLASWLLRPLAALGLWLLGGLYRLIAWLERGVPEPPQRLAARADPRAARVSTAHIVERMAR